MKHPMQYDDYQMKQTLREDWC